MFIPFKQLPNNSRIWIYQSDKEFAKEQINFISEKAKDFIEQWTRHGKDLKGSFTIKYDQFLVLAVDENFNNVSGCSIDASVHFVKELERELEVDLLNKMNISFRDGNHINISPMSSFKEYVKDGKITSETIVFNNMITTKEEFETQWEVPVKQSWHQKFLVN